MKSIASFVLIALVCVFLPGCQKKLPETLVTSGYDEKEMDQAIARARSKVDQFIAELQNPTGTDHSVKAPISDKDNTEHFWLTEITYNNGEFSGAIGNEPGLVKHVKLGQKWTIKKSEISDWMYLRDGKMYGNHTIRPLLKTMPAEEAEFYRKMLAEEN